MRIGLVPSIPVGTAIPRDRVFYADVARGTGLVDIVDVEVEGRHVRISGAELRAALLSTVHTGPWELAPIGAGRSALRLDPDGRSSTIAHLDAQGLSNPTYWLYRRGENGPVRLTRWTRAGYISSRELLEQAGLDPDLMTKSAQDEALTDVVGEELPQVLELRAPRSTGSPVPVEAPDPGWLDVEPGALKARPDRVPVHQVDDLGEWPIEGERTIDVT